jgi:tetratricopeptide (TPR) repeat protein
MAARMLDSSRKLIFLALLFAIPASVLAQYSQMDAAKQAYEKGDYTKAIELLKAEAAKEPANGDMQLLLAKSYLELNQYDAAVNSAEKAVSINPKSSVYHQLLGEAYGGKADHASALSAFSLARKTQKEFAAAVELDEKNFDAAQNLVEYDCTAPGVVNGGEDKAQPIIQKLLSLDAAEGHYAAGNCKAAKKDYAAADPEFTKALENKPKSAQRIFDIGDYFAERGQGEKLAQVAALGEATAPGDPRANYYRAVSWILTGQKQADAEKLLRAYLQAAPVRSSYPSPSSAHYWIGRSLDAQKKTAEARSEYELALKLNPKNKLAEDAMKHPGGQ